jgi:hypothetical protein
MTELEVDLKKFRLRPGDYGDYAWGTGGRGGTGTTLGATDGVALGAAGGAEG